MLLVFGFYSNTPCTAAKISTNNNKDNFPDRYENLLFTGHSRHWRYTVIAEIEERWTRDSKGMWHYNSSEKDQQKLAFLGKEPEKVGKVTWKCKGTSGEGWGTDYLGKDGVIGGAGGGEGISVVRKGDTSTMTVRWQGKTEHFSVKCRPYSSNTDLEHLYQEGLAYNGMVTEPNERLILMHVDSEPVFLSDWYYYEARDKSQAAAHGNRLPGKKDILHHLIGRKASVAAARKAGFYPSKAYMKAYINDQKRIVKNNSDARKLQQALLDGWEIDEAHYFEIMKNIWADSLAILNWHEKISRGKIHQRPGESSSAYRKRLLKFYDQQTEELIKKATLVKSTNIPNLDMLN